MKANRRIVAFFLFALTLCSAADSAATDVSHLQARFIAPCCWHENLAVHNSPIAEQMRAEIQRLVMQGKTEDQIVDLYVARYGEKILGEPRGRTFWILTIAPLIALAVATMALGEIIRRMAAHRQTPSVAVTGPLPDVDLE